MVSIKYIKSLDFETLHDYFNYILESEINGQRKQARELINKLSKQQKKECINYLKDYSNYIDAEILTEVLIESI